MISTSRPKYDSSKSDEQFKAIPKHPFYCIGNYGTVLTCTELGTQNCLQHWFYLKRFPHKDGYPRIRLDGITYSLHKLVMEIWVGPCPKGKQVCHFPDRNKENCRLDNLIYGTPKENSSHREIHGTTAKEETNGMNKLTLSQCKEIFDTPIIKNLEEIAKAFGVSTSVICRIKNKKHWSSKYA